MIYRKVALFSIGIALLFMNGCGGGSTNVADSRHIPPIAIADTNTTTHQLRADMNITLDASQSSDPDHEPLTYTWFDEHQNVLGHRQKMVWKTPQQEGVYTITLVVTDSDGLSSSAKLTLTVLSDSFDDIRKLIRNAKNGVYNDVTFICVGDSTRAHEEEFKGYYVYDRLHDQLQNNNVRTLLLAHSGEKAAYFDLLPSDQLDADERTYDNDGYPYDFDTAGWPKWTDLIDANNVAGDGNHTIVSISLGINDVLYTDGETLTRRAARVKQNLKDAIEKVRQTKPFIHFILTVPYRGYDDNESYDSETNLRLGEEAKALKNSYKKLSDELHLPLIDIQKRFMSEDPRTNPEWIHWFRHVAGDTAHVHLQPQYQAQIADYILEMILPVN